MFQTVPSAEIPFLSNLNSNGVRSWRWVEFGLQIPYFLITLHRKAELDAETSQQLLLSHLDDVLSLAADDGNTLRITEIGILSPGYMNGTGSYRLDRIKEIWRSKTSRQRQMYVIDDGSQLIFEVCAPGQSQNDMELALRLAA